MRASLNELQSAQLTALQNQITPHYIVNALEAVRMKLLLDGQKESAELLRCLQNSMKTYGFAPDEKISLAEEFVFLEEFLKFHQFRFLGKLRWSMDLPDELERLQIPRFLLQPLVENAVRHGLSADMHNPRLEMKARLLDNLLCISVSDNGKGFTDIKETRGIGLTNVKERLYLLYGGNATVEVESRSGCGTSVTLRLPEKGDSYI